MIAARSIASEGRESTHLSCFRRLSAIPEMAHDPADTEQRLDDRGCCAVSKAFMCRVSTQITGSSAAINPLTSHCDSGPASIPIRPEDTPSEVRTAMMRPDRLVLSAPRSPRRHHRPRTPTLSLLTRLDQRNGPSHRSFLDDRGRPTSIRYRLRKGTRTHHPSLSRGRRDTPS